MPSLHKPKAEPLSLFIPTATATATATEGHQLVDEEYNEDGGGVGTLFVMEGSDDYTGDETSCHFEAYTYDQRRTTPSHLKSWKCQPLPSPPKWTTLCPKITSRAVVGGGAHVVISAEGVGTYRMDTATQEWSQVGRWMLPLYGKAEYVPELGLWFGFSAKHHLPAADLSDLGSKPRKVGTWSEFDPPEDDWRVTREPQLVNLGSGRFCVARFFHTSTMVNSGYCSDDEEDELIERAFCVLTGVEVVPHVHERHANDDGSGNGDGGGVKLRMIKHKSRFYVSADATTFIESVF